MKITREEKALAVETLKTIAELATTPGASNDPGTWLTVLQMIEREASIALTILDHD